MSEKRRRKKDKDSAKKKSKKPEHSKPENFDPLAQDEYVESNKHAFDPHEQGRERQEPDKALPASSLDTGLS